MWNHARIWTRTKSSPSGISVNCSDIYRFNIDCQWVDVSELEPGDYTIKISVNPEFKVAEMAYDNNAANCNLAYTETSAHVYNCKMERPWILVYVWIYSYIVCFYWLIVPVMMILSYKIIKNRRWWCGRFFLCTHNNIQQNETIFIWSKCFSYSNSQIPLGTLYFICAPKWIMYFSNFSFSLYFHLFRVHMCLCKFNEIK